MRLLKLQVLSLVLMSAVLTHWALDCTGAEPGTNSALANGRCRGGEHPLQAARLRWAVRSTMMVQVVYHDSPGSLSAHAALCRC